MWYKFHAPVKMYSVVTLNFNSYNSHYLIYTNFLYICD